MVDGRAVCGVTWSSTSRQGPMHSASRTTAQPVGVIQVVSRMFVPGS